VNVLRYGNTRDLALGLEVVLADGSVLGGLRGLRKDNTGYDLKQLFIGSEGTLGVITGAVLKLFPMPRTSVTAFAAVPDPAAAIALLGRLREQVGNRVSAFELVSRLSIELVLTHIPGTRDPLAAASPWYVLTNVDDPRTESDLRPALEQALGDAVEAGLVTDAALAESDAQAQALWRIRESIPDASKVEGLLYRHDISVPTSDIPSFIDEAGARLEAAFPGTRVVCFGHIGDVTCTTTATCRGGCATIRSRSPRPMSTRWCSAWCTSAPDRSARSTASARPRWPSCRITRARSNST
jgi:FAD/FMN-containing dehydrogenase